MLCCVVCHLALDQCLDCHVGDVAWVLEGVLADWQSRCSVATLRVKEDFLDVTTCQSVHVCQGGDEKCGCQGQANHFFCYDILKVVLTE